MDHHPPRDLPGLIRRPQVLADGGSDTGIRRRQRAGELLTVRNGCYVPTAEVAELDDDDRHRLLMLACPTTPSLPFSHVSAAVARRVPIWAADLGRVHVTRVGRSGGGLTRHRHVHSARLLPDEIEVLGGWWVTTTARTLVDVARSHPTATAVIAADHALRERLVSGPELRDALARSRMLPGGAAAADALRLTDGRSESPGETRTRLALVDLLPLTPQVEIRDARGRFVARVDLLCEEAMLIIEFDGQAKYQALLRPGQTTLEVVLAEKRREDALRELGYLVIRVVWSDLGDQLALRDRVLAAYRRGLALRAAGMAPVGPTTSSPRIGP